MSYGTFTPPPPRQFGRPPPGPPGPAPQPIPMPIPGVEIYDSAKTLLHNGIPRKFISEGNLGPNGKGIECRASGSPYIQVNPDHTFSLICQPGHGRFYVYALNYNAVMDLTCAFWNNNCRDLSLKMRSRHNMPDPCANRFGGYGLDIDRGGNWGAKREPCHNNHDQSQSGRIPFAPQVGQYFTIRFLVKGNGPVLQQGFLNGQQFMQRTDPSPQGYMVNPALYNQNSYIWVRQNNTSGIAELRVKRLQMFVA